MFSEYLIERIINLPASQGLSESLNFFILNSIRIFILITVIGFVVGLIRSFIPPKRIGKILSGKKTGMGNIIAAFLGVVSPVDSFTVIPMFIGLLESGVPLGVAISFITTAPITSEIAFALFLGLFGTDAALAYYAAGILTGVITGIIIDFMRLDKYIEPEIYNTRINLANNYKNRELTDKISDAGRFDFDFIKKIWIYVLLGVAIAALLKSFVPSDIITKYTVFENPFAIPIMVILVIFFYINIAAALPIIIIFANNGLPVGTIIAFTIAATVTSIPELVILKKALKPPLLIIYLGVMFALIIISGYLLNFIFRMP